ncbi:hypothetical protein [Ancylobacter sp.]|uniref:hypothetical protein n=1 Tax=Ancylobacter sp. TaxID=1872567 RepID=UPI003C7E3366
MREDGRDVHLRDILHLLKPRGDLAAWELDHGEEGEFWATATRGHDIDWAQAIAGTGQRLSGETLRARADDILQVITGEFRAFEGAAAAPWLMVRAFDSSFYEIITEDEAVLAVARQHFSW